MEFSAVQVRHLQDLCGGEPLTRGQSATAEYLSSNYNLGRPNGRGFSYTSADHENARNLLRNHNLPLTPKVMTRAEAAQYGMSEKQFSEKPHADSIAIKVIGHCTMHGRAIWTPAGTHLIVRLADAMQIECDRIMVVENFEPFRRLEEYAWIPADKSVLVIYRGDKILPLKRAAELIEQRKEAAWGFFDYDPAGLAMAHALPNLERLVHPPLEWLKIEGRTALGRQLFEVQLQQYERILDATHHPVIRPAWRVMSGMGGAVTQEKMSAYRHHSAEISAS